MNELKNIMEELKKVDTQIDTLKKRKKLLENEKEEQITILLEEEN